MAGSVDKRTVLLGMNNPLSLRPEHALFPHPPGCTGHRIYGLLCLKFPDMLRHEYLEGFERVNLVEGHWSMRRARENVPAFVEKYQGRTVLLFGEAVRTALKLPKRLILPLERDGIVWRQLPHPSGRNLWYNDPRSRELAASLLAELYLRGNDNRRERWKSTSTCSDASTRT